MAEMKINSENAANYAPPMDSMVSGYSIKKEIV